MYNNGYLNNGYGYGGYNSSFPYYSQYTQTTQVTQPQQAPQVNGATHTNQIFVNGIEDVRNRQVPPNGSFVFTDNDKPILYEKIVDGKGQFEIKTYEIREITGQESTKHQDLEKFSDFVKKTDFEAFKAEFKKLENKITKISVQQEIDALKKD